MLDIATLRGLLGSPSERPWITTATVQKVHTDEDGEGVWIDVLLEATGQTSTCRLATPYAGPGFGLWILPPLGVEVVVAFASPGIPEKHGGVHPDLLHGVVLGIAPNDQAKLGAGADAPDANTLLLALGAGHKLVVKTAGGREMLRADADTATVTLGQGTANGNRAGDPVPATADMATWMGLVKTALTAITAGPVTSAAATACAAVTAPPSTIGTTDGGNPNVKV